MQGVVGASKSRSLGSMLSPPPPPRKKLLGRNSESRNNRNTTNNQTPDLETFPLSNGLESTREDFHDWKEDDGTSLIPNDFDGIVRDGEPLIVKKHMPLLRRKSSSGSNGSKCRNPLRAFAARLDSNKSPI